MFGISYGELFLLIGATAALVGTKDLPIVARTAGRLAGRAIGYVQLARGQFDNVMQQSQARQVLSFFFYFFLHENQNNSHFLNTL
jgi:Sec-independent protein translocase protein TatA